VITVFVVTDTRLYRDGLAASLDDRDGLRVVGCGAFDDDSLHRLCSVMPDTVVIGHAALDRGPMVRAWITRLPASRFVVIGSHDDENEIIACTSLGVSGIVPLEASLDELVLTLKCAARGEFRCSPRATAALARQVASSRGSTPPPPPTPIAIALTRREREIAKLIAKGFSNKQIARTLDIQLSTVKNHVHRILEKLDVSSRGEAAAHLRDHGQLQPPEPVLPGSPFM
jgi:DNA-binding NarL/FixJ family response regulator